ncbi:hypothetical protein C3486_20395 [Streptomyces sp. Ru73]|uniref:chaplin n=1 Tax=Streptomyces sp. Ru73 TaxID=2080748 RepID=UPI000CDD00F8|nr:chaplin [Streptomyces sp. Ru73]POX39037.1 hypothetical protein C3486_20395 [Streptomyces sp. Ru73]
MRKVARKSLITVVAAGGVLAVSGGYAHADAGASGASAHSPGVLSGNSVQAPVHVPVNVCGNTVNVVGLLNPASGNSCGNGSGGGDHGGGSHGGHGSGPAAGAEGGTHDSPGVGSGNSVQAPVDAPINICGNSVTIIGGLNPVTTGDCGNTGTTKPPTGPEKPGPGKPPGDDTPPSPHQPDHPGKPGTPEKPTHPGGNEGGNVHPQTPPHSQHEIVTTPAADSRTAGHQQLAETGPGPVGALLPAGAALLGAGVILYRKARPTARGLRG